MSKLRRRWQTGVVLVVRNGDFQEFEEDHAVVVVGGGGGCFCGKEQRPIINGGALVAAKVSKYYSASIYGGLGQCAC